MMQVNQNTLVRISRATDARLMARAARLFLAWGARPLADAAAIRRVNLVIQRRGRPSPLTGLR